MGPLLVHDRSNVDAGEQGHSVGVWKSPSELDELLEGTLRLRGRHQRLHELVRLLGAVASRLGAAEELARLHGLQREVDHGRQGAKLLGSACFMVPIEENRFGAHDKKFPAPSVAKGISSAGKLAVSRSISVASADSRTESIDSHPPSPLVIQSSSPAFPPSSQLQIA